MDFQLSETVNQRGRIMFGFNTKSKKQVALNQRMGRLINDTFTMDELAMQTAGTQNRSESRSKRSLPCLMFLGSQAEAPECYATGVTVDLSIQGFSVFTGERLESVEYIIAMGRTEERILLLGDCRYSRPRELGAYFSGFELRDVLKAVEYPAIVRAIRIIEDQYLSATQS